MEARLGTIFAQVNDWLKFAEAKNAALVAANVALILGAMQAMSGVVHPTLWLKMYLTGFVACLGVGATTALLSFLPETRVLPRPPRSRPSTGDNLFFFGHIAKHSPQSYLDALREREGNASNATIGPVDEDLAVQIITNSRITLRKYAYFKLALWATLFGIMTPVGGIIALLVFAARRKF